MAPFTELHVFINSKPRRKKKGPALIESHGSSTLCMWTSVRSIFLSSIAVFLSVFPCYVTQFFSAPDPLPPKSFISSRFSSQCVLLSSFFSPSLVCKFYFCNCACTSVTDSMDMLKKKRDFSCWSHAKRFELPLKYGRCFLNALYSFCCKIIKKGKNEENSRTKFATSFCFLFYFEGRNVGVFSFDQHVSHQHFLLRKDD